MIIVEISIKISLSKQGDGSVWERLGATGSDWGRLRGSAREDWREDWIWDWREDWREDER